MRSGGRAPRPLTLAGAGSPSVIAGSKDMVGKANGAREVSCSRSRWPKSACHEEQGDGSPVLKLDLPLACLSPEHPTGLARGCPHPEASGRVPRARERPGLGTAPGKPSPSKGLTSEPRAGLGPCSLSLGELHPEAGVLLLLGEESERGEGKGRRSQGREWSTLPGQDSRARFLPSWDYFFCFLPRGTESCQTATSLRHLQPMFLGS